MEYAINRALKGPEGPNPEAAVKIANRFWGAPTDNPHTVYDPKLTDVKTGKPSYGQTEYWAGTDVSAITYGGPSTGSARTLLSTAYHEGVMHLSQTPNNWADPNRPIARAVNELEAYRAEDAIADRLGLDTQQRQLIRDQIAAQLDIIRGSPYEARVAAGNYRLFDSDLITR